MNNINDMVWGRLAFEDHRSKSEKVVDFICSTGRSTVSGKILDPIVFVLEKLCKVLKYVTIFLFAFSPVAHFLELKWMNTYIYDDLDILYLPIIYIILKAATGLLDIASCMGFFSMVGILSLVATAITGIMYKMGSMDPDIVRKLGWFSMFCFGIRLIQWLLYHVISGIRSTYRFLQRSFPREKHD